MGRGGGIPIVNATVGRVSTCVVQFPRIDERRQVLFGKEGWR